MAFDKSRPYGQCVGGVLDGHVVQDGRHYNSKGVEVGTDGVPVVVDKMAAVRAAKVAKAAQVANAAQASVPVSDLKQNME